MMSKQQTHLGDMYLRQWLLPEGLGWFRRSSVCEAFCDIGCKKKKEATDQIRLDQICLLNYADMLTWLDMVDHCSRLPLKEGKLGWVNAEIVFLRWTRVCVCCGVTALCMHVCIT